MIYIRVGSCGKFVSPIFCLLFDFAGRKQNSCWMNQTRAEWKPCLCVIIIISFSQCFAFHFAAFVGCAFNYDKRFFLSEIIVELAKTTLERCVFQKGIFIFYTEDGHGRYFLYIMCTTEFLLTQIWCNEVNKWAKHITLYIFFGGGQTKAPCSVHLVSVWYRNLEL